MRSAKLTTDQVLDVFTDELTSRGGNITDTFNDGRRLFCRSVLPLADKVRPGDQINGGIALKATDEQICVYPYTFREWCRNGAIHAETVGSLVIEGLHQLAPYFVLQSIREGIDQCAAPEVFNGTMNKMRHTLESKVDLILNLMPLLSGFSGRDATRFFSDILDRLFEEKEHTQFGLANAITSLARDTGDPQPHWDLEELGGGLLIAAPTRLPKDGARAAQSNRTGTAVSVA